MTATRLPRFQRLLAFAVPLALFATLFVAFDANAYPPGQVHTQNGRFVRDGQPITLKGVNVEVLEYFTAADFQQMANEGFNLVRLRVHWAKLQPTPPTMTANGWWARTYDDAQLQRIKNYIAFARNAGMVTLVDNHECKWCSKSWYPDWAAQAAYNGTGITYNLNTNAGLNAFHAAQWTDQTRIQHHGAYLEWLADQLRDVPGIVGYEILNEPPPGDLEPTAANALLMSEVMRGWGYRMRNADPDRILFFQTRYGFLPALETFDLDKWVNLGNVAADLHNGFGARWGTGLYDDPTDSRHNQIAQRVNQNLHTAASAPYSGTVVAQRLMLLDRLADLEPYDIPLFVGEWGWGWDTGRSNAGSIIGGMCMVGDARISWAYRDWKGDRGVYLNNGQRSAWADLIRDAARTPCPGS